MGFSWKRRLVEVVLYAVLILFALWTLFPLYWMVSASLKTRLQIFDTPRLRFTPTLANYREAFALYGGLARSFLNSTIMMGFSVALSLVFGIPAAYSLGRFQYKGKKQLSSFVLNLRIMPPVVIALPLYFMAARLKMLDSYPTLIILYTVFNFPFVIYMLKGFFADIPKDIEESAQIDGCSRMRTIAFMLPLVAPGIVATAIFSAILTWNEFIAALVLTGRTTRTVPVELTTNITSAGIEWGKLMAGGTVALLPIMVLAVLIQKHLIRGLTLGAVKE